MQLQIYSSFLDFVCVGFLFSNVVDQEQVNTILKDYGPSSSETYSPFGYVGSRTKVTKDIPSSFVIITIHIDDKYYPFIYQFIYLFHNKHMNKILVTLIPSASLKVLKRERLQFNMNSTGVLFTYLQARDGARVKIHL